MRSLKLSRRGTPISATERAKKSCSLVLAVRSAEDVMTVVTSGRFPSIGHLTELLSKRAVERVSNVTPTTDQIDGDQHETEDKLRNQRREKSPTPAYSPKSQHNNQTQHTPGN